MALFGRKPANSNDAGPADLAGPGPGGADPVKAARFFDRAKTIHESSQYEYATTLWLQGLRFDPTSLSALESFVVSAQAFAANEKRDKPSKEQAKNFGGKGPVEKYLEALLWWGIRPTDPSLGMKVLDAAAKVDSPGVSDMSAPGHWLGERVLGAAASNDKPKKDTFVKAMDLLAKLRCFDLAVKSGEVALRLDPSDANLEAEVRNMGAQMAMTRGGYEKTGQEGGFRANVRDAEKQRLLDEEGRSVRSEDATTRIVEAARADYESRPTDRNAIAKYARALQQSGRPEDEKAAYDLLTKAYDDTGEFRFRQAAGDLRLRFARRKVSEVKAAAEAKPGDEALAEKLKQAQAAFLKLELEEYTLRVENYPTDLGLKYELGVRCFITGDNDRAIALFQESQHDSRARSRSLNYLGKAFSRIGWNDEAVDTYRRALESLETETDDHGLEVRYGLMEALAAKARDHRDLAAAEEAYKIGSGIAIQQISYRDIRARRDELQGLVKELRGVGA